MKQISEKTACYSCLGCNKLELEWFNGVYHCKNQVKVISKPEINENITKAQNNKKQTGEQLRF